MLGRANAINALQFASVKYGTIVTDVKGSVGGTTFKGTRAGAAIQNKINSNSSAKRGGRLNTNDATRVVPAQRNLSRVISLWRGIFSTVRAQWIAAAPNFPFINRFGVPYTPSGYQLFLSVNLKLLSVNQNTTIIPPTVQPVANCPAFTVTQETLGLFVMLFTVVVPGSYFMQLYATSGQSSGRQFQPSRLKLIQTGLSGSISNSNILAAYQNVYGDPIIGTTIWFEGRIIQAATGQVAQAYRLSLNMR